MKSSDENRFAVINDLLELSKPLNNIKVQLGELEWDYEGAGVELTCKHLLVILQRYLRDELSANDVETWANLVEGRDDVSFESRHELLVENILYELANPALTQVLDKARAAVLMELMHENNQ